MNCYLCAMDGVTSVSVAICTHCGVAMCMKHLQEAGTYSVGGTKYDCPHNPTKVTAK